MGEIVPLVILNQPRLASQEDITDDSISVVQKPTFLDDPVFEPLQEALWFRIKQLQCDHGDTQDDENSVLKYEIKNVSKNLYYIGKYRRGELTGASCHDGSHGCDIIIETVQGEPVIELEGFPGYSGLEQMKVTHGDERIGEIIQKDDCCSPCNPQYTILRANGEELLHIPVLDGGFCCGIFGVTKYMIVSSNQETALGKIDDESQRIQLWNRKLLADEKKPLKEFKIVLTEQLDLETKVLLMAAAFTVNFHNTAWRFEKRKQFPQFQPL
ncbi:unnamed protein product [Allacma fusca]|uniref:Phospholipid scramblase n=1 Tax=Allacma fusca TaxID=39272 RepID=A0A8J2KNU4_9HEXA|nr:unnamed protein product [Allacma fusca]